MSLPQHSNSHRQSKQLQPRRLKRQILVGRRLLPGILMFVGTLMLALLVSQTNAGKKAVDFEQSIITVDKDRAQVGDTLTYRVKIRNDGKEVAHNVLVSDTLSGVLAYVPNTLRVITSEAVTLTSRTLSSNQIIWQGDIPANGEVELLFKTVIRDVPELDTHVLTMLSIEHEALNFSRIVATEIVEEHLVFLPIVSKPMLPPAIVAVTAPVRSDTRDAHYEWQIDWESSTDAVDGTTNYELEEATDPDFSRNVQYYTTTELSQQISKEISSDNVYYYRLRVVDGVGSGWSNDVSVVSAYRDDFEDETSGWQIRREDADDTDNELLYENGNLKLWVHGRWDYMIASSLAPAPQPPYRITFRVKFAGPANRNSYGLVYGGDSAGADCPADSAETPAPGNATAPMAGCLNHYYRANMLWFSGSDEMKLQVKQIDFHDKNNEGRGSDRLKQWGNVQLDSSTANGWVEWRVEVYPDGQQKLYAGDQLLMDVVDDSYIDEPYWGFMAATNAMIGSDPLIDWVLVEPLEGGEVVIQQIATPESVEAYP